MASTSSSISTATFDVFLSFRGEDTRYSFTDHLYKALHQAGISTFRDDDEISEGQALKPEIERSIKESRASIVIISETFSNSSWCLDELWLILQQKRNCNHFVLPVFYKVDPSDVRNHRRSFKMEAKEGVGGSKWTVENVNRWKESLTEVANLKGAVVSGFETKFISDIVDKIYNKLDLKLVSIPTDLTGIEARAHAINLWLENEQHGYPALAICGMGGSGKTTLAKYIYNTNKQTFEGSSFLESVESQPDGLLGLQKQLLKDVSRNNRVIGNVSEGTYQIEKILRMKKVLIVVDDIDDKDQLTTLFGTSLLHTQSKIIITTRLLDIDTWFGSISYRCHVDQIQLLNYNESLEVLSWHAFGSKIPMEGFEELARKLALYCEGNPLALKVLGSSLHVRSQDPWTKNNMMEVWRSRMNSLNSLKGDLDHKLQIVLRKSFESLPCDSHKELFLHIACLLVGNYSFLVEMIFENDLYAKSGIVTLVNRCLVSQECGKLWVHKLLQDMAKKIVDEESKDPATRSIVWCHDESYRLLRLGDGSEKIKGLVLDMHYVVQRMESEITHYAEPMIESEETHYSEQRMESDVIHYTELRTEPEEQMHCPEQSMELEPLKTSSLVKMKNLKLLQLNHVKLTGSYWNFPELRWLRWYGCNLKAIPQGLLMGSLVAIDMKFSDLKKFEPPTVLNSLKILDFTCCYELVSICNLHRLPKLEQLLLLRCSSLTHVCKTIEDLRNLSLLELSGCTKLWNAASNQLDSLIALFICGGTPEIPLFSLPVSLIELRSRRNPFDFLPDCIDLNRLHNLDLSNCPNLKSLPWLPSTLRNLHVDWCTSLENITFQSARFTLQVFSYEGCFKLCEIQGLFKLVSIAKLDAAELGDMHWTKAYQNHKVDLFGDVITQGRTFNVQMMYEYGIRSIYLQGIKDQSMEKHEYKSSSEFLSFRVPSHLKNHSIQGLNITVLYSSSSGEHWEEMTPPFVRIINTTRGLTWVYSPVLYCKPRVDNCDVVWLSNWPLGDGLYADDEVDVDVILHKGSMMARGCGASIVYMDDFDSQVQKEKIKVNGEEVIGGDLSQFEVTKGGYYLYRTNFFDSGTSDWLKRLFGDNIHYADSRRWRISGRCAFQEANTYQNHERVRLEVELGVSFSSESETDKIETEVSNIEGVEFVFTQKRKGRLTVVGRVNPQALTKCVREFENLVQVLSWKILP